MNLPRASVRRPVFTSMVTLIIVVVGLVSFSRLRTDLLPPIEMTTLSVSTDYEGASPEVMERLVTQIVEEILATVPGVEEMSSSSSEGNSSVSITFGWGTDIDSAATDVRAKLEDELNELPEDVGRPQVRKWDINSSPIVILGIASNLDPVELTTVVNDQVRQRFARLPGVAQVDLWGGYDREVRVELDPDRIRALGVPLNDVLTALRDSNLDLPAGQIEAGQYEVTLRAPAEFGSLADIRETIVAQQDGVPVALSQIAEIKDTYERITRSVRVNGKLGLRVAIRKQADANTVEVSSAILEEIERTNRDLPQLEIVPVVNQGNFIERSIANVANSVLYGGSLAVLVLLVFLRSIRSTLAIALAIPISVIATFALVYMGGFTLNLMTLGGLALGVGMMVDNSIVVLENIFRRQREDAENAVDAATHGAAEVGPAIVASTLTTLVIFLPIIFVRGVSGMLFRELALVIVFALVASLVVSLSIVPMIASKLFGRGGDGKQPKRNALLRLTDRFFDGLDRGYVSMVNTALRFRAVTVLFTLALLGGSVLLVPRIGTEFIPPSDEGEVRVSGEMDIGTRLDIVDGQTRLIEEIVNANVPEMRASVTTAGASGWNPSSGSEGSVRISLVPVMERERSNSEVAEDLRQKLEGKIPGMIVRTRAPQGQFMLERLVGGDDGITVEVRGYDLEALNLLADRAADAIRDIPGVTDVDTDSDPGAPQREIRIDRAKAADVGVSVRDIAEALEIAVAGNQAGQFRPEGNSYRILVQFKDAQRLTIDQVLDLSVRSESGEDVALRNLVVVDESRGPTVIRRKDQQRLVRVRVNIAERDLGSVAAEIEEALAGIPKPVGYGYVMAGNVEEQREANRELGIALFLAIALVYMVLACQYESLRDPLIVMTAVPLAAIGVIVTLFVTETTFNIQSAIGCIMLAGIVVNNAILLVDQTTRLRRLDGAPIREAISEAGRRRLRPILMTSLTTMLGLAPLAMGIGEGADAQAPLARTVIGGLAVSTVTTLFLVPVIYSLAHRERAVAKAEAAQGQRGERSPRRRAHPPREGVREQAAPQI